MNPLVSIIIPVYNKAAYVSQTIDSALAQTYQNIEIILVDDGSTDGSKLIIRRYAKQFPEKIVLIEQENSGVSKATNKGISYAKGEYIQFLDADDLISSNKIKNQVNLLLGKGKMTMASCEWVTFVKSNTIYENWSLGVYKDYEIPIQMLLDLYNNAEMMQPAVYLCHRELIDRAGAWDETLIINQDGEFFMRVLLQAEKILYESTQKVYYRKPGVTNVSQQKSFMASASLLESYRCYERELRNKEDSIRVRIALAKNYLRFIYVTYPKYPELIREAEMEFKKFHFDSPVRIGGPKFRNLSKFLGFKNAIRLKRFLS
ncbi:glycosyltransferase family 2 protein [Echinicola marina]|uniref:glycosyltransferase family 2 protein n=1 Tax=Echinicola marina TaxID=2859768 RepID=UPI001CF7145A|nr:glycosyltransferase family 2 protein [Echinicola marina]UCS91997.1 glycosyltransferase family 2 protein [Echinicola marina]